MTAHADNATPSITTRGAVNAHDEAYAMEKISRVTANADGPVLFAEVKLTQEPDPARQRPSIAEAVLDVNGQPVRAHVSAHEMRAAIDLLEDRLRRRLERHAHARDDRRERRDLHQEREANEWRHGDPQSARPEYFDRPVDERVLVRRKSFASHEMLPDEAADALYLLSHDFFLFTNLCTGADAVVFHADDDELELIDASGREDSLGLETAGPIHLSKLDAPRCTTAEALQELDLGLTPFVFFVDAETGRGNVAYRRYDGHYGLIVAA